MIGCADHTGLGRCRLGCRRAVQDVPRSRMMTHRMRCPVLNRVPPALIVIATLSLVAPERPRAQASGPFTMDDILARTPARLQIWCIIALRFSYRRRLTKITHVMGTHVVGRYR